MVAVVSFGFDLDYVLGLTIAGLNHLLAKAREVKADEIALLANTQRAAVNADPKEFESFLKALQPARKKQEITTPTARQIEEGKRKLRALFGGGQR